MNFVSKILPKIDKVQGSTVGSSFQPVSIFRNNNYLLSYLTYCDHCLDILYVNKQTIYACDQCPSFVACEKCVNLVSASHPTQHTFTKSKVSNDVVGRHIGITCDGCKERNIRSLRYQCEQCEKSYDLCYECFRQSKKIHNASHTFKFIQDPLIRSSNRQVLAQRAIDWLARQKTLNIIAREPVTGWTKNDAEQVIQNEKVFLQDYKRTKQQIEEIEWYDMKQQQEHEARMAQMFIESNRKQQDMWINSLNRIQQMDIESYNRISDILSAPAGAYRPRYY